MLKRADQEPGPSKRTHDPRFVTGVILAQGLLFLAAGAAIWVWTGRDLSDFVRWRTSDLLAALLVGGGLMAFAAVLTRAFPRFLPWSAEKQKELFVGRGYSRLQILLLAAAAGIGEEALFRGGLQTFASDHLPAAAAILLSAALFAALHPISVGIVAMVFAIGLLFGIIYEVTGSLLGVMLAHAAYDVWALAIVQRELARRGMLG